MSASRVEGLRESDAGLLERLALRYSRRRFGKVLEPLAVTAHHRRLLLGYGAFEMALERSGRVGGRLKELAATKAAAMVGCEFCIDFGSALGRQSGITERQLAELPRFRDSEAFSILEKLVLEYAEAVTATPAEVPDELAARLGERFDDEQIVELTAAIAFENYRARFNHAFGLGSQGFSAGATCAIAER